jgi:transposase
LAGHGEISAVGVEGTGSYGAGLTRWLTAHQIKVVEVNRPNRADRRRRGKSDPVDAEHAAVAVLANTAATVPKARTGLVESIRLIHATPGRRGEGPHCCPEHLYQHHPDQP